MVGTTHAEIICLKSQFWTHRTKGQISTGLMSITRVFWPKQVILLLVSFSSGFFAAILPWRPDSRSLLWTVDVVMCLLLEVCEAFIWAAISEAGNSNELILCIRGNSGSSFPVASWEPVSSQRLMVFATALEETFKVLYIFRIDWTSCLNVMADCHYA